MTKATANLLLETVQFQVTPTPTQAADPAVVELFTTLARWIGVGGG
jgi:hypothetical protein